VLGEEEDPESEEEEEEEEELKQNGTTDEKSEDGSSSIGTIEGPGRTGPLEIEETREHTQEKMKSPAQQLTEQAAARRIRSKERNARAARDVACGVRYRLLLDPRLQVPPHDEGAIEAVMVPAKRGVYIAAVIYRVPPDRRTDKTKTILISHGNATDCGAMFPIQVVLAHSLDCNVVVYDYSGYGMSGGVPDEAATYRDIDAVYDYVLDQVAEGRESNIILYGQSVGSGPCCYLAAKRDCEVGGMILHSPFTSGMRVLTPSRYVALNGERSTILPDLFSHSVVFSPSYLQITRLFGHLS
jgi:pimeloyl-ACP methyl ester carboxylesterase